MAIPAPAVPPGNAYTVHVAAPAPASGDFPSPLPSCAAAAALLLRRWKVPVRQHAAGDNPAVNALRGLLNGAGARASAFSPAPSAEAPGEGFWKTTLIVVQAVPGGDFWAEPRDDRKVEWDPLLVALCEAGLPADFPPDRVALPDLWCVAARGEDPVRVAEDWARRGAGAVAILGAETVAWTSFNAVFGRSAGSRGSIPPGAGLGVFAAGVVAGMIRDLLGENLFEKTLVRADRACLEMRPLRLGRACAEGIAALQGAVEEAAALKAAEGLSSLATGYGDMMMLLRKESGFAERAEECLARLRGPEAKPWGVPGR